MAFSKVANYGLVFAGILLFLMQMHGLSHSSNPDEFGFSSDNHLHEHMQMESNKAALKPPSSHESAF